MFDSFEKIILRISSTSFSVIFAFALSLPLRTFSGCFLAQCLSPLACVPSRIISSTLSLSVPDFKCDGLQHIVFLQTTCLTSSSCPMTPPPSMNAIRCAPNESPLILNWPYLSHFGIHSQQSFCPSIFTFDQKRFCVSGLMLRVRASASFSGLLASLEIVNVLPFWTFPCVS